MSLNSELSKVRDGFSKVRSDMIFLSKQMGENYDEFMKKHNDVSDKVEKLTEEVRSHIKNIKETHIVNESDASKSDILYLKNQIKELKDEISLVHQEHFNVSKVMEDLKKDKTDIKDLKNKLQSSELEIFLLKERLVEKDSEIKQLKDVSKNIFDVLDELAKVEVDMLNLEQKKK
jgi:predicted RNase H-like nuclease (RuvC/YqgF family)